ncbi:MAG: hydroxymethylglutaryl-CoA synthase [Chloroflexi bacterium]|nr:hydroxymethylglutaryl-CoA synthase [Chloroflexota bacterium]
MAVGIMGYGVYVPRYRIKKEEIGKAWEGGGRGELALANPDEDVVTMGVEASFNAKAHGGVQDDIDMIYLGTNSPPYAEHSSTGGIAEALGCNTDLDLAEFVGSPRSSMAALKAALDAIEARRRRHALVIGSDRRPAGAGSDLEMNFGAGAAAFILGDNPLIAEVEGTFSYSTGFLDRWRGAQDPYVRDYDPRFTREYGYVQHVTKAGKGLLEKMGRKASDYAHVVFQQPDDRVAREVAKKLGLSPEQLEGGMLFPRIGDTGSASALLGLAAVLDKANPGDRILVVSYGAGNSDAISLVASKSIKDRRVEGYPLETYLTRAEYVDYLRFLRYKGLLKRMGDPIEMAVPPASAALWRASAEMHTLLGAKCRKCGYVNFPPSIRKICIRCGNTEFESTPMSKRGQIHTYSLNYYMPPPFEAPLPLITADMDDGRRFASIGTEMKADGMSVGMPVELVLRVFTIERGVTIYGYKFRPLLSK